MRVKALLTALMVFTALSASAAFAGAEGISGVEWRVTAIRDENRELREVLENTELTAVFSEDGSIYGSSGCNRYRAGFGSLENIEVEAVASTRKFCSWPEGIMEQENRFIQALKSFKGFNMDRPRLELLDAGGEIVLILEEDVKENGVAGLLGEWRVESIEGKKLLPGTEITMIFTEDGRLVGRATINSYFTSWIEAEGLILFGLAATTMMGGPQDQMNQEAEFLKKLSEVRSYEIQGKTLIMTMVGGGRIVAVPAKAE